MALAISGSYLLFFFCTYYVHLNALLYLISCVPLCKVVELKGELQVRELEALFLLDFFFGRVVLAYPRDMYSISCI